MVKDINVSLGQIRTRIKRVEQIVHEKDMIISQLSDQYYYESLKLNLIEIGEESKVLNDILLELDGSWNDIISRAYNLRVSLTHYYEKMHNELVDAYMGKRWKNFVSLISKLEEENK